MLNNNGRLLVPILSLRNLFLYVKSMKTIGNILLISLLAILLSSCATNMEDIKTVNELDLSVERDDFSLISEEGFFKSMEEEVEPYLDSIRKEGVFYSNLDGHRIYFQTFIRPDSKGSVVVLHGFSEFIEKYSEIIYYFSKQGYDVYMLEHFGHGFSERSVTVGDNLSKVVIDEFDVYVEDVEQFIEDVVKPIAPDDKPLFLYGHSMGGGIATRHLEKYPDTFDAAVLSSPMIEVNLGFTPKWVAKFISSSAKVFNAGDKYVFGHYDYTPEDLFSDPACPATSYNRYAYGLLKRYNDVYHQTYGATWSWLNASLKATDKMVKKSEAEKVTIPVLLFQAENDSLVKSGGQLKFASRAKNVNLIQCPDTHHEIFNSPDPIAKAYWICVFDFFDSVIR